MFLKSLVRVAGVGGAVSAATIFRHKQQESKEDNEAIHNNNLLQNVVRPVRTKDINPHLVSNSFADNASEEVGHVEDDDVKEVTDSEVMAETVTKPNETSKQQAQAEKLKAAITRARNMVWCKMYESGAPGMVVAVSVNGKTVWQHGFGYADLENHLLTGTACVMRIASISKSITMAVLAKLWQEGKVDLDKNITEYVPDFPQKMVNGKKVNITVRQLCCHMSGVRHYTKKGEGGEEEFDMQEYYLKETFKTTDDSLKLFKDDDLLSAPGAEFNYTTHGYTVLAKIIENVVGEPFEDYMTKQFKVLGLNNTFLDKAEPIIYNRAKYYVRDKHHRLRNAPYVDNSYKWAGGGYLSTVGDLVKFGNAMLYSYQQKNVIEQRLPVKDNVKESVKEAPKETSKEMTKEVVFQPGPMASVNNPEQKPEKKVRYLPGYLSSKTMTEVWTPQAGADLTWGGHDLTYGLGWAVRPRVKNYGYCMDQTHYVTHTGGAIGASSVLLVAPTSTADKDESKLPQGVVVTILCNLQSVGLNKLAADVAAVFQGLDLDKPVRVHKVYQC